MKAAIQVSILTLALAACGTKATPPSCLGGSTECDNSCVDLMADQANCGACNAACGPDTVCTAGACAPVAQLCNGGAMMCGTDCVDPMVDVANCGACGTACSPDQRCLSGTCSDEVWQMVESHASSGIVDGFSNAVPAGQTVNYVVLEGNALDSFTLPLNATDMGTYTSLAAPTSDDEYAFPAWSGTSLYVLSGASAFAHDTVGNAWTTPLATITHTVGSAEASAASDGKIYATATDGNLVQYDPVANTAAYFVEPSVANHGEPRSAWDEGTKRLYLADFEDSTGALYSFDPATSTFAQLTSLSPFGGEGFGDAFCADGRGHVYVAACEGGTSFWVYTAATDTWEPFVALPFDSGCNSSCFTTTDGWLYISSSLVTINAVESNGLARYRLFVPDAGGTN